jgi:digeranylgeranylglycerophospholipid reductase
VNGFLSKKIGLQDLKLKIAVGLEYNVRYLAPQSQAHLFIGAAFRGGYGWIFPLKNGRAIVGYGTFHKESIARLKQKLDAALHDQPMAELVRKDNAESYGGTIPAGPVKNTFVQGNIVCVGDSVSQVNPVVGEGYRFIMEASALAARSITEAVRSGRLELLSGYDTAWSRRFEKAYRKSKRIQLLADLCGRADALSDLACLAVRSMSDARFQKNLAANF